MLAAAGLLSNVVELEIFNIFDNTLTCGFIRLMHKKVLYMNVIPQFSDVRFKTEQKAIKLSEPKPEKCVCVYHLEECSIYSTFFLLSQVIIFS